MIKLITSVLVFIFIINILILPSFIHAQETPEKVDVYALFWPVVPGTTVADGMFWAKQLKEGFSGMFTFGSVNKAGYEIELSEKRLVEANKLVEDKDYSNALKSLKLNKQNREEAVKLQKKAREEKADANELTLKLGKSLEKQQKALAYLATQFPEDQKGEVDEMVLGLVLQISEAK